MPATHCYITKYPNVDGLLFFNFNHLITSHDFVGEEMRMGSIADLFCLSGCPSVVFTWQIGWSGEYKTLLLLVWCLGGVAGRLLSAETVDWSICVCTALQHGIVRIIRL